VKKKSVVIRIAAITAVCFLILFGLPTKEVKHEFVAKVTGFGPMTPDVHPCDNQKAGGRWTTYGIEVDPPLTITAENLGEGGTKTYTKIDLIYVTVLTDEEGAKLSKMESGDSPTQWKYRTAVRACINEINQEHLFLTELQPIPSKGGN
jgi:hypothetical protein